MGLSDFRAGCFATLKDWLAGRYSRTARLSHVALPSFSACCAHYPGGTAWVHWSVASPARDGLPLSSRGSASTSALSRLAQASLALRPADLLEPPTWPFVPGASTVRFSHLRPGSYLAVPTIARVDLSSTGLQRLRGAPKNPAFFFLELPIRHRHTEPALRRTGDECAYIGAVCQE